MRKTEIKTKKITRSFDLTAGITRNPKDPRLGAKRIVNMYVDKSKSPRHLTNVPGIFGTNPLGGRVNSLACHRQKGGDMIYVHAGDKIYSVPKQESYKHGKAKAILDGFENSSIAIDQEGYLLIFDGRRLFSVNAYGELDLISFDGDYSPKCLALFNNRVFLYDEASGGICYTSDISDGSILTVIGEAANIKGVKKMLSTPDRLYLITEGDVRSLKREGEGFIDAESFCGISCDDGMILDGRLLLLSDRLVSLPLPLQGGEVRLISDNISDILSGGGWSFGGVWRGYLVIYRGGEILLCDRDTIDGEPVWFMMSGVGCHARDKWVYHYGRYADPGFDVCPDPQDGFCRGEVISCFDENGKEYLYEERDGKKYQVYNRGTRWFGERLPPVALLATPRLLIFGTEEGNIGVCADDVMPNAETFLFDFHYPEIALELHPDDGGLPSTRKSCLPKSFNIRLKNTPDEYFEVKVRADGKEVSAKRFNTPDPTDVFLTEDRDIGEAVYGEQLFTLPTRARGFYKKQVEITASLRCYPISISEISYTLEYEKE